MNKLYADKNGKPIDKQNTATVEAVNKMIERQKATRERSSQIISYYTNGQQKGMRI